MYNVRTVTNCWCSAVWRGARIVIDIVPSTLCSGAGIKAAGDSAFKVRDVEGATRHYTAALKVDPLFVS